MLAFSAAYVAAGWVLLGLWGLGAEGLVGANAVNMLVRIIWTGAWVEGWWDEQGEARRQRSEKGLAEDVPRLRVLSEQTLPKAQTASVGMAAWAALYLVHGQYDAGSLADLAATVGVAGVAGLGM